ncbi:MAG: hypothetical protein WCP82_07295 [Alphaproteobacteria bacterium]
MNYPADVMNEALDAAGVDFTIGDPQEGTKAAQVTLRKYSQCMRQLLRSVHWDFARKQVPLVMLGDTTGDTDGVGTDVIAPWTYEYAYPTDCMKARFMPRNYLNPNATPSGNIALPTTPLTSVSTPPGFGMKLIPGPFLIGLDTNYPVDPDGNWLEMQGESPAGRVVVLSNINQAQLVYTAFMPYPSVWDSQFRAALVAYLAAEIALPLNKDKPFGLKIRELMMAEAKGKVISARITNGNESGSPQTVDHLPDWMSTRSSGGQVNGLLGPNGWAGGALNAGGYGWDGSGYAGMGWDSSVF